MSGSIEAFTDTGLNLYAMLWTSDAPPSAWDVVSNAFVGFTNANWIRFSIALGEWDGSGFYTAPVPAAISTGQRLVILVYNRLGSQPDPTDQAFGNSTGLWDGSAWESGWSTPIRTTSSGGAGIDVISINGSTSAAARLAESADSIINGGVAVTGTLTATQMTTNLAYSVTNVLVGRVVIFTTGALTGHAAVIAGSVLTNGKVTFLKPLPLAPSNGDHFIIV